MLLLGGRALWAENALAGPCDPPTNQIVCENSKPGNPRTEWDVEGAGDPSIQGFATDISVNRGQTVHFKVKTDATAYHLDIYRMGYYGGEGARKVETVQPSASLPQSQPPCETQPSSGLIDCGTWKESASWAVPANAVSGIYFAKLERTDQPSEGSQILFVVRDDSGHSDLLFQTADTTWQAYNSYGGNSLYEGGPGKEPDRAYKVSYNRPITTRASTPEDAPFAAEYPMVRWLERNGYDVSYSTGVDAARSGGEILEHKAFLSVGHDEYWSAEQRDNVEAARDAGVDLAFFSGNEVFWKTRWEDSIDGSGTDYRTMVCYKETHANKKIDPESDTWTGSWRDPRFSPPADGGQPENALTGTIFTVNSGTAEIEVPATDGKLRLWRHTGLSSLAPGKTAKLGTETLGYEWDEDLDNGFRPAGLIDLSSTTVEVPDHLIDYGSNYTPGTATHHLTLYRAPSGALVFGAGTVQWSWGLDEEHDRGAFPRSPDSRMQQATANLFADMGVQPRTLQEGLVPTAQSTDVDPPETTIVEPIDGAAVESGQPITVSGVATDTQGETAGGHVAGVEVSTDDGETWHPAEGRDQWTYKWTPGNTGEATVMARSTDDSGNLEEGGTESSFEVVPHACPCSIWDDSVVPDGDSDTSPIELGVKFRSDAAGFITGLRYYKTPGTTGTHVGRLWTAGGTELAQATFIDETASGWQEAKLDSPVAINASTTYVASYFASHGHYAAINDYFALVGADSAPLHALAAGVDGPNGIYRYGGSGDLFDSTPDSFRSTNYLADVVFDEDVAPDVTAPEVIAVNPITGATGVAIGASLTATFSEAIDPATLNASTVTLRDEQGVLAPGAISYDDVHRRLKFEPEDPLQHSATYTVTIKGGPEGVKDLAGNPLASDRAWSFTTAAPPPPPPDEGPGGPILVISNTGNPFSRYYAEILRAEGLSEFTATDISNLTPAVLAAHDVAILGEGDLNAGQAQMLESWVQAGGNLIAMQPDQQLAGLLGLSSSGGELANGYLKVDTSTAPGVGIVGQTIQFHGTADLYTATQANTIATLYASAEGAATPNPAVTWREVGPNGGHAAAFSYDLAKSVVYTRQGNRAWAGEDRDGVGPIRSDDLFFGAKKGNEEPDWVNLDKVQIPQADEQQRLLTNLIERMNLDRKPLPRFWFLPRDEKAAVVMTGDDHAHGGTAARFKQYEEDSPPGCSVAKWECVRSTAYIFPNTPLTDAQAASYSAAGFEIGLHAMTECADWSDQAELESFYSSQLAAIAGKFPSLPSPSTGRTHCVVWSDWATQPKVELQNGIRLDTNYYYWPDTWIQNRPGLFTGSGMPMRFADSDGSMIDVYQAATQMTDESGQSYPFTVNTLLDNALGPNGYYGVFTANMHTDSAESPESDAVVASAQARGVPVVSARQMLTWLDGRNQSSFGSVKWSGSELGFAINPGPGATGLRAMLPTSSPTGQLFELTHDGTPVVTTTQTIKGIEYAFFDATAGSYTAAYGPELSAVAPASPANQNSPKVSGSAPTGSTVSIYSSADCSGSPLATGSAAQFEGGIAVSVGDDSKTDLRVTATSAGGNTSPCSAPLVYVEDSAAPQTQIDSSPSALTTATAAAFGFSGNDGSGSGVASFECRRDAGAWGACTSPASYSGLGDGAHGFEARAIDQAGNIDASPATFAWTVDTTAPTLTIDSLSKALIGAGLSADLSWHANENGSFELRVGGSDCAGGTVIDSGAYGSQPAQRTSTISAADLAEGGNTIRLCLSDAAGNQASITTTLNKESVAPETQIDGSPGSPSASSAVSFSFSGNDGAGSGIASFECRRDAEGWGACGSPQDYSGLADGAHSFEVRAIDQAGNIDASPATFSWTIDTTAPQTQIDSSPDALSASAAAEFAFSGTDTGGSGVVSFECRRDSGAWGPCTTPQGYSGLADGSHGFEVRAIDQVGNVDGSPAGFSWSIDTTAPTTQIDSNPASLTASAAAKFTFSGADAGGSGVASFECRRDAGDWGDCSSPTDYASFADGAHSFEVRAIDKAGNTDASPASFDWTVDTTAPQTQIDSGPSVLTASAAASLAFSGTDPGGSGVVSFECRRDSGEWGACGSPQDYSALADGAHAFEVRAVDQAGNADASPASFDWTIDTTAPMTQIDSGPEGLTASASAELTFSGADSGGSGVDSFECRRDSGAWGACTSPHAYASLADGAHSFEVRAVDNAGNVDGSAATLAWTVDTTAPATQIDSRPSALMSSAAAEFAFSGSDAGGSGVASFECRRDSGAWATCTSPRDYSALADGGHNFEVHAIDKAGNVDASPATFDWSIDTTAPTTAIDSHPTLLSGSAAAEFTFSGADINGSGVSSFECRRDSGEWEACTSSQGYSDLADGAHVFEVRAIDKAGNVDGGPASFSWTIDTTAPTTQIDSSPSALVASASAKFTFSGADTGGSGVASFECRRDSGAWVPCVSPQNYSALADGAHGFAVRAIDEVGNVDESPATFAWSIDTSAPQTQIDSNPASLSASAIAKFTFSGTDTGGSGVASFECRLDSAAWDPCSSPTEYASLADGTHGFEVRSTDKAGNVDGSPASFDWTIDTTAPVVTIDSGPDGLTNDPTPTFAFHSGELGSSFKCSIDDGTPDYGPCAGAGSHTPASPLGDGSYSFRVRATDAAGNQGTAVQGFQLDTAAPPAPELNPTVPPSPANENSPKVIGSAPAGATVRLYAGASCSGSPVATVTAAELAAGVVVSVPDDSTTSFRATATSAAGNVSPCSAPLAYVEDSSAPQTQIDGHPADPDGSALATVVFSGSDVGGSGVASFECRLDSGAWGTCSSPQSYPSLADGAHDFEVRAIDKAGNVDGGPASFSWTIDMAAPTTQIDSSPPALTSSGTAELAFSGADAGGSGVASFQCRRDAGDWEACASPQSYSSLADGGHSFEVRTIDQAGNVDQSPASFAWTIDTTAPQTQIDSSPAALTASSTASFGFSGSDASGSGVASFECRRDAGAWGSCLSPQNYADLTDGAHSFEVRAIDQAGNVDGSPTTFEWTIDTTAPTTQIDSSPTALTASSSAEFGFSGADGGGSGVAGFECRRDSAGWEPCNSPKTYSGLADGAHSFEVRAIDQAGNVDASPTTHDWTIDATAPQTQIDSNPDSIASSPSASLGFSGSDTGGSGVASFECRLDSGSWGPCTSPQSYSSLADGSHSFEVRAIDQAGNVDATPATFSWSIDTTAPSTQIDSSPAALASSAATKFTFSGSDTGGSGIVSFECRLDSGAWGPCTSPQSYAGLVDGAHSFEVRAIDQAGNVDDSPATLGWTIDTTAPVTQIDSSPSDLTSSAAAEFAFSGTDTGGSGVAFFECRLDSGDWGGCSSPQSYASLSDGAHAFEVRVVDHADNVDGSPASFSWTVDTAAPAAPSLNSFLPASPANQNSPKIIGSAAAGSTVRLYAGADCSGSPLATVTAAQLAAGVAVTVLDDSTSVFTAAATSSAGNTSTCSAPLSYTEDSSAPQALIDSHPADPASSAIATFAFSGTDTGGSGVASFECRLDSTQPADWASCSSPKSYASLADGAHDFEVHAIDQAGNADTFPAAFHWSVDTAAPATPILNSTLPVSPANQNSPKVIGSAPAGSTVRLYATPGCSGSPVATVTAAELAAGVVVSVPDDSTTSFRATATSAAGNVSPCSAPLAYIEDSGAPQTQIDSSPASSSASPNATFGFSAVDAGGSGVASFQCRMDSTAPSAWAVCSSPAQYAGLADGTHGFEVRAIDPAGNADDSPAAFSWAIDTAETGGPSTSLRLVQVKYDKQKGTALLLIDVPGSGKLSVGTPKGAPRKGLRKKAGAKPSQKVGATIQIEPVSVQVTKAGRISVPIKLNSAGKKLLQANGKVKVEIEINFEPVKGAAESRRATITFKLKPRLRPRKR